MPRRKSKKLRRHQQQQDRHQSFVTTNTNSLEEDLKQQRLRQKDRNKQKEEELLLLDKQRQILDQQEQEQNVNEKEFSLRRRRPLVSQQDLVLRGMSTTRVQDIVGLPSLSLQFIQMESPVLLPRTRSYIQSVWHSKYLLENAVINHRATRLYDRKLKWRYHSLPDGMHYTTIDMTCKQNLHPAARTFDVAMMTTEVGGNLPTIATCIQGGFGLFAPSRSGNNRFHTLRGYV